MMRLLSYFSPKLPLYLVYMLQQVEYEPGDFWRWLKRLPNLLSVRRRKHLVWTMRAKLLASFAYMSALAWIAVVISFHIVIAVLLTPLIVIVLLFGALIIGTFLNQLSYGREIAEAEKVFAAHPGTKIAIAGSYGKTTIKELLLAVLGTEKKVVATPGNKNVSISHARWAATLSGEEDILLIEYGEGAPGDIARFAQNTHPDIGIITGLAPNHLDRYKTLEAVKADLYSLANYVAKDKLYSFDIYNSTEIIKPKISITGMEFGVKLGGKSVHFQTALVGRHLLGALALCIQLAHGLGLSNKQIQEGIMTTKPFEHRMQPRQLGGAWIIDDTYNGNLEGIKAGLELLQELPAKRKIYVTPGLVDQGRETERVHREIGVAIAKAAPDQVILMQNSVTKYINDGLVAAGYMGLTEIIDNPLEFYTNLEHRLATGDLVMMQNDWTDNYA